MHLQRSLAAVFAVSTLFVATACGAGDDLSNSAQDTSAPASTPPATTPPAATGASTPTDTATTSDTAAKGTVRISGQNFGEATLVADMYEQLLAKAGYTPDVKLVDTRAVYITTFPKSIDVVPEYVGGIVNQLNSDANGDKAKPIVAGDGAELASQGASLLKDAGITLLDQSSATDTNAFFVTKDYSDQNGVTKLSDLTGKSIVLAAAEDCDGRLDCAGGLSDDYGIDVSKILPLGYDTDATISAVTSGEAQLGETSTTDGTLDAKGLVLLQDDKQIQPAQNLVPAVSTKFLTAHPDIADVLNPLMAALTTEKLAQLNAEVSVERKKPEDVATEFLTSAGLL